MIPASVVYHQASRELELVYADGQSHQLSAEFLRVQSPSAEVKGHGGEGAVLQSGKKNVAIVNIEPCGNYALRIVFSDGHRTGLYSWEYLQTLCLDHDRLWTRYLEELAASGQSRDEVPAVSMFTPPR